MNDITRTSKEEVIRWLHRINKQGGLGFDAHAALDNALLYLRGEPVKPSNAPAWLKFATYARQITSPSEYEEDPPMWRVLGQSGHTYRGATLVEALRDFWDSEIRHRDMDGKPIEAEPVSAPEPAPALTDRVPHDIAVKILRVRDLLVEKDYDEAYHVLYSIADPSYTSFTPWAELERTAQPPTPEWQTICFQLRDWVHHLTSCAIYSLPRKPCDCGLQSILDRASALTKGESR